ncbi:pheromone-regulated protein PRM2 Ecym_4368 [Eremothecium cymbalariae DBVPG|uniref:Uncharacterized protein n=1 Tax=Eremothecium cymbalariae (strain CBS 270.75 / DBVPG 7215 / KCTC 17166 / NRRL Y-17582) TaxID=931890 RepID=G8JTS3_ERECY|nr:hypothetical protein Ecym_4368 [Eremothecium cymbalariae DBVPG\
MNTELLHWTSLKVKLVSCLFNPIILVPTFVYLVSIWTVYSLEQSLSNTDLIQSLTTETQTLVQTQTQTETPTQPTATVTIEPTTTPTHTSLPRLDIASINKTLIEYIDNELNFTVSFVNKHVINDFNGTIATSLNNWNKSLHDGVQNQQTMLQAIVEYNNSIWDNLRRQSERINSTIDELSSSGFTIGSNNGGQIINDLRLDYEFVPEMFSSVSADLEKVQDFEFRDLPYLEWTRIDYEGLLSEFTNIREDLLKNLQLLIENRTDVFFLASENLKSRDVEQERPAPRNSRKLAIRLTIGVIMLAMVSLVLLFLKEWLCYSLQNHEMIHAIAAEVSTRLEDNEDELSITDSLKRRKWLNDKVRSIACSFEYTLTHYIVNLQSRFYKARCISSKSPPDWNVRFSNLRWKQLSLYNIWIIGQHGLVLWLTLFVIVTDWQLISTLIPKSDITLASNQHALLLKRSVSYRAAPSPHPSQIIAELCHTFQNSIDTQSASILNKTLLSSAEEHSLQTATSVLSDQMTAVIADVAASLPSSLILPQMVLPTTQYPLTLTPLHKPHGRRPPKYLRPS